MEALVEVVDHVPVINFRNRVTVSKVPFDVVTQGLGGALHDTAQIPSGFRARIGCLVVLDEGSAEVLPAVCNTRFLKGHKPSNHIRARIRSHVYTTE